MSATVHDKQCPKGWRKVKLDEILTLINGRAYKKEEERDEGTPVLRIQNLNGGERWFYSDLTLPADKYCMAGDLLFAWSATFGPYIWSGQRAIYHYHIWKVECGQDLDKQFAYYLLQNITDEVKAAGRGISMIHMTKGGMEAWEVSIPPLAEQKRIAAILDQTDGLRRKRQHSLDRLSALGQAIFHEMFGDPEANAKRLPKVALGDLIKVSSGIGLVAADQRGGAFPVFGGNGVNGWHDESTVSEGTIIIGRVGVYCGSVHMTDRPAWVTDNALIVSQKRAMNKTYLATALRIANLNQFAGRSAQPLVSGTRIYPVEILMPSMEAQEAYEKQVHGIDLAVSHMSKAADLADHLFQSLQHRAFRGEL